MNKKIVGGMLFSSVAFAAMGCPSETSGGGGDPAVQMARVSVALEKLIVNCSGLPTATAKGLAAAQSGFFARSVSLQDIAKVDKAIACLEAQSTTCSASGVVCDGIDELVGVAETGTACISDGECKSNHCAGGVADLSFSDSDVACGTCAASAQLGESCDSNVSTATPDCGGGLRCNSDSKKCEARPSTRPAAAAVGQTCGSASSTSGESIPCGPDLQCKSGKCEVRPKLGEACTGFCGGGAKCDITGSKKCIAGDAVLAVGSACVDGLDACADGGRCVGTPGKGVCTAMTKAGEACSVGKECQIGFFCGTGKKCLDAKTDLSCPLK